MLKNLGGPGTSCKSQEQVGMTNHKKAWRRVSKPGESDQIIVLREWESHLQGEG